MRPENMRLVLDNNELEEGRLDAPKLIKDIPGITNDITIHLVLKSS